MRRVIALGVIFATLSAARSEQPAELMVTYLERYHRLAERDVESRMELAEWCADRGLVNQQADVLLEVLSLQPGHPVAYERLIAADARRTRTVDPQWAEKLARLPGEGFHLHHSAHFTLICETGVRDPATTAQAMEDVYRQFYRRMRSLGLKPMPPAGRLVGVLFASHQRYRDYLDRYEAAGDLPVSGYYSWRTNRAAFFDDRDNPAFASVRQEIAAVDDRIAALRAELNAGSHALSPSLMQAREQLKRLQQTRRDMAARLEHVAAVATLAKVRHEVAHQLCYNSGLLQRGRQYPFWIVEGLAMLFEQPGPDDADDSQWPPVNRHRLASYAKAQQAGRLITVPELLAVRPGAEQNADSLSDLYAQAWALACYLARDHPAILAGYIESLSASETSRDGGAHALRRLEGVERLDDRLREAMRRLRDESAQEDR